MLYTYAYLLYYNTINYARKQKTNTLNLFTTAKNKKKKNQAIVPF